MAEFTAVFFSSWRFLEKKHLVCILFIDCRTGEKDVDEAYAAGAHRTGSAEGGPGQR